VENPSELGNQVMERGNFWADFQKFLQKLPNVTKILSKTVVWPNLQKKSWNFTIFTQKISCSVLIFFLLFTGYRVNFLLVT